MGAKRQVEEQESPEAEKERLLAELYVLDCRAESIKEATEAREARLKTLMNAGGDINLHSERHGSAGFAPRRAFKLIDEKVAATRLTKELLAMGFKPTAAIVDALAQKGVSIDGMIQVGVNEVWSYRRPTTAEAEARRRKFIDESRRAAEAKVAEIVATL